MPGAPTVENQESGIETLPASTPEWGGPVGNTQSLEGPSMNTRPWGGSSMNTRPWEGPSMNTRQWEGPSMNTRPWEGPSMNTRPWEGPSMNTRTWGEPSMNTRPWGGHSMNTRPRWPQTGRMQVTGHNLKRDNFTNKDMQPRFSDPNENQNYGSASPSTKGNIEIIPAYSSQQV